MAATELLGRMLDGEKDTNNLRVQKYQSNKNLS
jgi:hypothetical protein